VIKALDATPPQPMQVNNGHGHESTITNMDNMNETMSGMFFETSSTLITFVILGRYLEVIAKGKTSEALNKLINLQAINAILITLQDGKITSEEEIDVNLLNKKDIVKVIRGSKIPADGTIIFGTSTIDESLITGESLPVTKTIGDKVIGSTINQEGLLYVEITNTGTESTLSNILTLMENAQINKTQIQAFADKISDIFVPIIVVLSICVFVIWFTLAITNSLPASWTEEDGKFLFSFLFGLSVLGNKIYIIYQICYGLIKFIY
jgi:Cu+-exporting ATPase